MVFIRFSALPHRSYLSMGTKHTKPTHTVLRVREHYRRLNLEKGWGVDRMHRLCALMKVTPDELCALCNCGRQPWLDYTRQKKFPGPLTLLFATMEQAYVAVLTGSPGEPIIPLPPLTLQPL